MSKRTARKRKLDIRHSERALLTDTLPFELPIFFTNENLAILAYLARTKKASNPFHERLLLSTDLAPKVATKPHTFEISRNAPTNRRLSLTHPRSQHLVSIFYGKYEQFITNACSRSQYSIRYPSRVATHYIDPRYVEERLADSRLKGADEDPVGFRDQSRWASTYFSYKEYSLSHKFFDSDEFIGMERRHPFLMKLDISRCFDSIYTHSIEWSMRGKDFSKDHLPNPRSSKTTFESTFDSVIRNANQNETHGIVVGPESSRIFAEIILQAVDRQIAESIEDNRLSDIAIRRYVDDYYVFGNSEAELDQVQSIIRTCLLRANLHLNDGKKSITKRPFSTKTSAARFRVADAIDTFFSSCEQIVASEHGSDTRKIENQWTRVLKEIRNVSVQLDVPYEQFSSIALSVIGNKLADRRQALKERPIELGEVRLGRQSWLLACIRLAQFLFAIDGRVTTSLKLASIYNHVLSLAPLLQCTRAPLESQILDGLRNDALGLISRKVDQITRINHLCAVDLLLTEGRQINENDILIHVGDFKEIASLEKLSLFQVVAILFIARKRKRFAAAREAIKKEIERRIFQMGIKLPIDTESTLLLTDYIACPHFESAEKVDLVRYAHRAVLGSDCTALHAASLIENAKWISFTDWDGTSDIARMLARRELTPAYE